MPMLTMPVRSPTSPHSAASTRTGESRNMRLITGVVLDGSRL